MIELKNVCLIIDFEGFFVNGRFHVREMGYFSLTDEENASYLFNLKKITRIITRKERYTADWCTMNKHGLTIVSAPFEKDLFVEDNLIQLVKNCYVRSKKATKDIVGYKGGNVEEQLLNELGIKHLNLEDYGCPKFEHLPPLENEIDCGHHVIKNKHCAKVKCKAFAKWVKLQCKNEYLI